MQRVEAGRDLHALGLVDGLAVGHVDPRLLQRRTAVGEAILHHEVLRALRVDERRDIRPLGGNHRGDILAAELLQLLADGIGRARRDLVDHRPRERDLRLVGDVIHKRLRHKALLQPLVRHGQHRAAQLLAVVAAIIHGDDGQRRLAVFKAVQQHGADNRHRAGRLVRAVVDIRLNEREERSGGVFERVALLRDGEGNHLQARIGEDRLEAAPCLRHARLRLDGLAQRAEHALVGRRVRVERDGQHEVVIRRVNLIHHVEIEGLHAGDAAIHFALGDQRIGQTAHEDAEDVARAEVRPDRVRLRLFGRRLNVVFRQLDAGALPRGSILDSFKRQFHTLIPSSRSCRWLPRGR